MTDTEIDALLADLDFRCEPHCNDAAALIRELRRQDLRARFAGQAMQGLLAEGIRDYDPSKSKLAKMSVDRADALIAELAKERVK